MLNTENSENGNNKGEIQHVSHFLDKAKNKIKLQANKKRSINVLGGLAQSGLLPPRIGKVLLKVAQRAILDDGSLDNEEKRKQLRRLQYRDLFADVLGPNHKFDYNRGHGMSQEVVVGKNGYYKARVKGGSKTERILYLKPDCTDLPRLQDSRLKDLQVVVEGKKDDSKAFLQFFATR